MDTVDILWTANCCSCGRPVQGNSRYLNIVGLEYLVGWDYPKMGNFITGEHNRATAIVCDECYDQKKVPLNALEFKEGKIVSHPVTELQKIENQ